MMAARRLFPLVELTLARCREFLREPDAIFWVYVFPLFLVLALGIAFRDSPVERFHVAVLNDPSAEATLAVLRADSRFAAEALDEPAARSRLRLGRIDLMIASRPAERPTYIFLFNPTRPQSVLARDAADDLLQRAAGRRDAAERIDQTFDEPGGRYIDFLIPGLIGMGLMGGGMWGVGFASVDMRIRKLLKRYRATPMRRSDFLASLILSRLLFTLPEVSLLVLFSSWLFGVGCAGSYATLAALVVLGALQFAGLGLLVAMRAQTIETVMGLMNAVMMPMWIGSGIFFSIERFPEAVQPFLHALPLTPLLAALRQVMLEGAGWTAVAPQAALIVGWTIASFAVALRWFRWT